MELLYPSILFTLIIILILKLNRPKSDNKLSLPPGPWQLPIIGCMHHMLGSLPQRILRDLFLIHGPIMHLKLGETTNIIISSPDAVRGIIKIHDVNFSSRPMTNIIQVMSYGGKSFVFAPFGDYRRQIRKVCVFGLLSSSRVNSFQPIRAEEILSLVRTISSSPSDRINLTQLINALTNNITMRAVVGYKCGDQEGLLEAMNNVVAEAGGFDLVDLIPSSRAVRLLIGKKLGRIHQNLDRILDGLLQEHRERRVGGQPAVDLLDALLRLQEDGDDEVPSLR